MYRPIYQSSSFRVVSLKRIIACSLLIFSCGCSGLGRSVYQPCVSQPTPWECSQCDCCCDSGGSLFDWSPNRMWDSCSQRIIPRRTPFQSRFVIDDSSYFTPTRNRRRYCTDSCCDIEPSCAVPPSCEVPTSCAIPPTCEVPTCVAPTCVAPSCVAPVSCAVPETCSLPSNEYLSPACVCPTECLETPSCIAPPTCVVPDHCIEPACQFPDYVGEESYGAWEDSEGWRQYGEVESGETLPIALPAPTQKTKESAPHTPAEPKKIPAPVQKKSPAKKTGAFVPPLVPPVR